MESLLYFIAILSGIFALLFYVAIVRDSFRHGIKPNATSWFIWSLNDTLILVASWEVGAQNTLAVPLVFAIFGWAIFFVGLRHEKRLPDPLESVCLIGALAGWIWYLMAFGTFAALVIGVVVNIVGAVPIMASLWQNSKAERFNSWILVWISGALSVISLERYSLELTIFPVTSFLLSSAIVLLMVFEWKSWCCGKRLAAN